jgi:uncharacterized protein (DUF1697 family)
MTTYIALFRGVNVGGRHVLPMNELRVMLETNGCRHVQTYVQSGNAIFRSSLSDTRRIARMLAAAVSKARGFEPRVLVLTRSEIERAATRNPFPEAIAQPTSLHLFFLADPPGHPDVKGLSALKTARERFALDGSVFYLYTPDGFGKSRLAARAERLLGVDATARNWRTVTALLELMK